MSSLSLVCSPKQLVTVFYAVATHLPSATIQRCMHQADVLVERVKANALEPVRKLG